MAGRKRKSGKRTKSGQLSRAGKPRIDRGNPVTEAKFERFGTFGADAIGRAFSAGLLGHDGQILWDTGKAMQRAYRSIYGQGLIRCALADSTGGSAFFEDSERQWNLKQWLDRQLAVVGAPGSLNRILFDQFVMDEMPDFGPPWLDRLLAKTGTDDDRARLDHAKRILEDCAGIRNALDKAA